MIGSDGYEYETLTDRILGRKAKGDRNRYLQNLQITHSPEEARQRIKAWDAVIKSGSEDEIKKAYDHFFHTDFRARTGHTGYFKLKFNSGDDFGTVGFTTDPAQPTS